VRVNSESIYEYERSPRLLLAAFRLLCIRGSFLSEYYAMLDPAHWKEMELKWIVAECVSHFSARKAAPQFQTLRMRLEADTNLDDEGAKRILRILDKLDTFELDDETCAYVLATFEGFITYRATLYAIHAAQEFVQDGDLDAAVQVVRESQNVRRYNDTWLTLPDDAPRFFEWFDPEALALATVPIGIDPLDKKLGGGGRKGELGIIVAPLGFGKSQFLVHIGATAFRKGLNVVHFTFENSEEETLARYDYNLLDTDSDVLLQFKPDEERFLQVFKRMQEYGGRLKIKKLQGSSTTAVDLSQYLTRLAETEFVADVVIVDYGDLMAAARRSSHQSKKYEELQTVFEELREVASEHNCVLWTASQANRDGLKGKRVLTEHIADALGKAFTADIIISMSKDKKERDGHDATIAVDQLSEPPDNGVRILHLLKLRRGGSDNWWVSARAHFSQAKLVVLDWEEPNDDDIVIQPSTIWGSGSQRKAAE